ncbi:hypothetical protein K1T71_012447 [Dendrolimus kikuchii]|uniref:Uncharacterized protein n=1 Tax=Dendrolimus kikuchii TaxID=765133 RepID=A0ACC1CJR0_9NEOP|nr:hypothetical protein K1T71_012447 [Dendrolimus kikuchii]
MRCELPDVKRCCFCLPLRRGLLAWGYIRVALIMLLWMPIGAITYFSLGFTGRIDPTLVSIILLLLTDFLFNISFLVAAHTKNFKLLRVYYYYMMVCSVVITIAILVLMGLSFSTRNSPKTLTVGISLALLSLATQGYITILVRSEIKKLENSGQFQFVNNAAQSHVVSNLEMGKTGADLMPYPEEGKETSLVQLSIIKMRCELPDPKRCCFCIPLRRGLLAWGYIRVVFAGTASNNYVLNFFQVLTLLLWLPLGVLFHFSFLIRGSKNFKLLRVYYYYMMVFTVVITIVIIVLMGLSVEDSPIALESGISLAVLSFATQSYITILVRSEIKKLENSGQVQFMNNEAQSQVVSNLEMADTGVKEKNNIPKKGSMVFS